LVVRKVEQFVPQDLSEIRIQAAQTGEDVVCRSFTDEQWQTALAAGPAYTARRDGTVLCCAGIIPQWSGRAITWSFLSEDITPKDMLFVTRQVKSLLDSVQLLPMYRRIETTVKNDFWQGIRWAGILGFIPEGILRCYDPHGNDYIMYARIR